MSALRHEWRLLLRSRLSLAGLALLLAISALAVFSGLQEVARQRATIERLERLQAHDLAGAHVGGHGPPAADGAPPAATPGAAACRRRSTARMRASSSRSSNGLGM